MTLAGLMEAARAVNMHRQNMRNQNKFNDVSPQLKSEKKKWNLIRLYQLSLARQKRPPARFK